METMTAPRTERFKMLLHVTRAVEENGKTYVEGIATGSQEDWYGDVMAPECVASMVRQFNAGTLPLRSSHQADWEGDLGVIESGQVEYGGDASIRALLDMEDARAQKLVRSLTRERPAKLGLSIGGMANYDSITWDTRDDKVVRVIHDITLDHVAVTSQPAYPHAWMSGVAQKSAPAAPHAFPWYAGIRKALDALQAEPPAPPAAAAVTPAAPEGGTAVEDVTKAAGDPPADPTAEDPSTEACPGMSGEWKTIDSIGPGDQVLCMKVASSSEEDKSVTQNGQDGAAVEKGGLTEERVLELAATAAAAVVKSLGLVPAKAADAPAPADATAGDNAPNRDDAIVKGVRHDDAATRPAQGGGGAVNTIEALKASDAYKNAPPLERQQMLAAALSAGLRQ